jgi:hypothetical protein
VSTTERDLIVGGQAVIEGVMMRTPNAYAVAVRKADGTIVNIAAVLPKWSDKYPVLKLPILRGSAVLVQSMGLGIKALNYSASEAFSEAETTEAKDVAMNLSPAVIEGEADFAGITGAMPGFIPMPTQKNAKDELKGATAGAASSIVIAMFFNLLLHRRAAAFNERDFYRHELGAARKFCAIGERERHRADERRRFNCCRREQRINRERSLVHTHDENCWWSLRPVRPSVFFNLVDGLIRMSFFLIMIFSFRS